MPHPDAALRFPRPSVMGILNITPDSFSDGGLHLEPAVAAAVARRQLADGAAIVDVGGESTRPGAEPVPVDEELRRVVPVLELLEGLPVSIDTSKAPVAARAIELGAAMVNDVTALRGDPEMLAVIAGSDAAVCLMHMQRTPATMQKAPRYEDVVSEVVAFFEQRLELAVAAGIDERRIALDPGIGFGKTADHNLALLRSLDRLVALGRPLLLGVSRKSLLGKILGDPAARRGTVASSIAAAVAAFDRGAAIFRVHDVRETVEALAVASAVERGELG